MLNNGCRLRGEFVAEAEFPQALAQEHVVHQLSLGGFQSTNRGDGFASECHHVPHDEGQFATEEVSGGQGGRLIEAVDHDGIADIAQGFRGLFRNNCREDGSGLVIGQEGSHHDPQIVLILANIGIDERHEFMAGRLEGLDHGIQLARALGGRVPGKNDPRLDRGMGMAGLGDDLFHPGVGRFLIVVHGEKDLSLAGITGVEGRAKIVLNAGVQPLDRADDGDGRKHRRHDRLGARPDGTALPDIKSPDPKQEDAHQQHQ